ncbi:hypothetical protein SAMN02910297_00638 [Methanobrevibacter olleyae]|uniref:Uncharacterized protein n=1 Tax=Methanobrevibacter olleyae TaxID=294671 RepID=A0A1I4GXQ6_METOL|nr:hypothetical protein [Methanobrevibacter olleyae]SFL34784.1 hypothetical protein SAMN02910297_00638 [Methanobrevibacter olleyae]
MKKFIFLITFILILFVSLSSVNAGLFWDTTMECQQFSITLPEGFSESEGWGSNDEHTNEIYAGTGIPSGDEVHRWLVIQELGTTKNYTDFYDFGDRLDNKVVVDNYTNGSLLVEKCYSITSKRFNGIENYTYAEFDKDGYHYGMLISYESDLDDLKLSTDVELVKNVMNSVNHKK